MPSIYDVAGALDTRGVVGPALEAGGRIRLQEQTALEQPARFARDKQTWQRQDELYAMQKQTMAEVKIWDNLRNLATVSQSPQTFLKHMDKLGIPADNPFYQSLQEEMRSAIGDPVKHAKIIGDLTDMAGQATRQGNMAIEQYRGQIDLTKTGMQGTNQLAVAKIGEAGANTRSQAQIASQEKMADYGRTLTRELAEQKWNAAWQDVVTGSLDKDGAWIPGSPFYDAGARGWFVFDRPAKVDEKGIEDAVNKRARILMDRIGMKNPQAKATDVGSTGTKPKFSVKQP